MAENELHISGIGVASDVYGLGALLCRLLAGRAPVVEDGRMRAPSAIASADTPWRGELQGDLDAIVLKACAPVPQDRWTSARRMREALEAWGIDGVENLIEKGVAVQP